MDATLFLPLRSVELDILIGVAGRPTHGYGILKEAQERRGGHPGFEIPTLYRALRRLRDSGLVRSLGRPAGPAGHERRQYWQATDLGQEVLALEIERLEAVVAVGKERVARSARESA